MAIIDLLAILPFYLPFFFTLDLRVLRMFRLLRLIPLLKINRYTNALSTLAAVIKGKATQLLASMMVVSLLMIIASLLMYNIENAAQPNVFDNAFSGLWWAVSTLTGINYGDLYPITDVGKFLGGFIAFLGIGLVAVPTGIISAGLMENLTNEKEKEKEQEQKHFCPYCGKKID
jgi:voltage-gated potassium channel